jgi:protein kinase A
MGTVRIAKTKNDKYVVFKSMRKEAIMKHNDMRHVNSEKQVLNSLNCSFCIKLFATFQDKHCIYLALEFAPGGELFHRLSKKEYFSSEVAKFYISEIFVALEHVHSLGFVYRDLKPENVLLDEEGHCKLVDFGFCTSANTSSGKMHTMCGTPAYLSPEQLDGKFTNGYTKVVDWWSFGILAYELRTGQTPFCRSSDDSHYEIFLRVLKKRISFPMRFDTPTKELVSSLLFADLSKRLCEPSQIKKHSYFTVAWDKVAQRRLIPPFVPRIKTAGDDHYFDRYNEPGPVGDRDDNEHRNEFFDF